MLKEKMAYLKGRGLKTETKETYQLVLVCCYSNEIRFRKGERFHLL